VITMATVATIGVVKDVKCWSATATPASSAARMRMMRLSWMCIILFLSAGLTRPKKRTTTLTWLCCAMSAITELKPVTVLESSWICSSD